MPLTFLKAPPPSVELLPDTQFFTRAIPVPDAQTHADVAPQIALALETLAPFPVAHMYYGYHWLPGAKHALAYAAYRKRFNQASVESWSATDAVLPAFATLFNPAARPATTAILNTPDTITAIHWADGTGVPSLVLSRALPQPKEDETPLTDEQVAATRASLRQELLRATPGTIHLHEYELPALDTAPPPARADNALIFTTPATTNSQTTQQTTTFATAQLDALDVRDKTQLAARRAARRRDHLLWRVFQGCLLLLALSALADIARIGGNFYHGKRTQQVRQQAPYVAEIEKQSALANRIEDLSTKRLLPFEMIDLLRPSLPNSILFTRIVTRSLNSIEIQARTNNASEFNAYRSALGSQANIEKVEVTSSNIRDNSATFTLVITFAPGAVIAAEDIPPPPPPSPESPKLPAQEGDPAQQTEQPQPAENAPSIHEQIQQQTTQEQSPADARPPRSPRLPPAPQPENGAPPPNPAPGEGEQ